MSDKKVESPGGWDAKINAGTEAKDAAGKAMGYEDQETQMREDHLEHEKGKKPDARSPR
ncbi:hypothetical protein [Aurantimonas endophytica]|uniref:Uncharacterized protein n=1 Tax=Aurantimonas endophytica TaxID=1522175 RepID=A0A7W6MMZ5_9HYPH|nr:hypothetical protein [Aurantimonas endophytica]MBB4001324.1 hypothetical protein [Aurantimonas endophytica]MCO6403033.1 hypothetical protein [Aurantimonas endophytica]